ncbi:response regulator [Cohnella sp. WQ 127256]|uniref:response regulator n=1 Tax=Cohnella sp. WQ 127256 TaxID=2938790 RepID=UPI0021198F35|nr:response regulator [Cohnella sp. WQ 127256]
MRAILVDDEGLALRDLERQLGKIGGIEVVATFQNANEALQQIAELKPDVVFLDIEMPEISGLEAADKLQQIDSSIDIVFVTAYAEYAIKAFDLAALDYVLKPINSVRLQRTIERLMHHKPNLFEQTSEPIVAMVHCFKKLHIDYGKSEPFSWRTARSQELFAYMIYKRNQSVRKDVLLELMWPNTDYKKAYTQLYTTIYQLRKSLEAAGITIRLSNSGSDYYLDMGNNLYDVQEWENARQDLPELSMDTVPDHVKWLHAYEGEYLSEHDYLWAENEKQRLRDVWYKHALAVSQACIDAGNTHEAIEIYDTIEKKFPYLEEIYVLSMKLHVNSGYLHLANKKYEQLCSMLLEEYNIQPSQSITQWVKQLNN